MNNKKTCKFCRSEIDEKATICPNCKKLIKFPIKTWIGLTLFILAIAFSIGMLFSLGDNTSSNPNENFTYEVTNSGPSDDETIYRIEGIVTNKTNKEFSYVQIDFICYDSDNNNIGTVWANTNNLLGNETWKFNAIGYFKNSKVDYCHFKEISAW